MQRAAEVYTRYLEWLCERSGHLGGCDLLNAPQRGLRPWRRFVNVVLRAAIG